MTSLERNVRQTQWRLGINAWLAALGWCLVCGAALWCLIILTDKLLGLNLPLLATCGGLLAGGLLVSVVLARRRAMDRVAAAAILDEAADLKERTGSALYCQDSNDPFAQAVREDAEHRNQNLSVRSFIKLTWPSSLSFASLAIVLALIMTWLPISPLQASEEAVAEKEQRDLVREDVKRVRKRLQRLEEQAKKNPAMKTLQQQMRTVAQLPEEKMETPEQVRREAIKNIDKLADAVRKRREDKLEKMNSIKRMFRGLKHTRQSKSPTDKLSRSLAKGDFRAAREALKELREQLAKLERRQDDQEREKVRKKIDALAKQLNQLAQQEEQKKKLEDELKKAGVDPETAKRALENLSKADLDRVKEQMKKQGASEQQIKEMMKKMQGQQTASQQASKMASAMQQAAKAMQSGSSAAAGAQQLQSMGQMLDSLEQLDQELSELNSMLADAQAAQNEFSDQQNGMCQKCGGGGCKACNGTGQVKGGMGPRPGQGRGGRASEQKTGERWVKRRSPVITTPGGIIGKKFVDGEQVRGEVSAEIIEVFSAAEREATDALEDNKIPNQYRNAVKDYFSQIVRELERHKPAQKGTPAAEASDEEN